MPRNGSVDDIRYFRGPARWSFHTMNAFEEDGKIHLDTTAAVANAFFKDVHGNPLPFGGYKQSGWDRENGRGGGDTLSSQ
jgi:carotenoid cleavage dioxygenase